MIEKQKVTEINGLLVEADKAIQKLGMRIGKDYELDVTHTFDGALVKSATVKIFFTKEQRHDIIRTVLRNGN